MRERSLAPLVTALSKKVCCTPHRKVCAMTHPFSERKNTPLGALLSAPRGVFFLSLAAAGGEWMSQSQPDRVVTSVTNPFTFINPAIYNWKFTAATVTLQHWPLHPAPQACSQMLQSQKLQQT